MLGPLPCAMARTVKVIRVLGGSMNYWASLVVCLGVLGFIWISVRADRKKKRRGPEN